MPIIFYISEYRFILLLMRVAADGEVFGVAFVVHPLLGTISLNFVRKA
jgi:hypothetical protein